MPWRHDAVGDLVANILGSRPHVVVGEKRHRADLARSVTGCAVLVEDRRDVFRERRHRRFRRRLIGGPAGAGDRYAQDDCGRAKGKEGLHATTFRCFAFYFGPPDVTAGAFCDAGETRMPVYCISSQVSSPHITSTVGSGFERFPAELSYHAVDRILEPFGTCNGSLDM